MATDSAERLLDVREIDGPPFDDIVAALDDLGADERLRLVAPFEPAPLYEVLEERGFDYESERRSGDLWHVLVREA
ncbi:DUF2249 domain-containing protein [Salinilacihabitans rarus]|uniref:DUF2249 domain-containing protein n=1 Tax=Salinilacihabitans rarus TaxID=2961596 RepID=UPI0020C931D3|nr:DUF2249 domain-containing protein [Salinilacihabitans rarus]